LLLAIVFLQTITGAYTPACLFTANDPVETVTPPYGAVACGLPGQVGECLWHSKNSLYCTPPEHWAILSF